MEKLINETNKIIADMGAGNIAETNNKLLERLVSADNPKEQDKIQSDINLLNMRIRLDMESK